MTRTARRQKKKFEEASSWNEMKTSSINKRYAKGRGSKVIDEKRQRMIERRRMRRAMAKVCFKCRQPFHKLDECPENKEEKICFKCGSSDHSIKECQVKLPTGIIKS
jgi:zinc finger CCHC domain-containing protein 9